MPYEHALAFDPQGEVVVWRVAETAHWFIDQLSLAPGMWQEFHQIGVPAVRLQWLASRFALQQVAKSRDMDIHKDTNGKPHLVNDHRFISISHCQGFAAAAAAEVAVGIDVELISGRVQRIKDRFLSVWEQVLLGPTDAHLMLAWSAKEAVYKMHGARKLLFKEHMQIENVDFELRTMALRLVLPEKENVLTVHFLLDQDKVVSWVY